MKTLAWIGVSAVWLLALNAPMALGQPNPYTEASNWPVVNNYRALGSVSDVYPDSAGIVWVAERCGANSCAGKLGVEPIIAFDIESGRVAASFGAGLFAWPHGIYVDHDGNIWVADGRAEGGVGRQVIKFSPTGEELMRLGQAGIAGNGPNQFSGPTGVVVAADGSIFVADGHDEGANHRVMKFSAAGAFIKAWGQLGSAAGQFNVPHALAMDSAGRLYVADRDNNRVQIFDQEGNFIDQWTQFGRPSDIFITANDEVYVTDNQSNDARHPGWMRGIRVGNVRDAVVTAFIPDPAFDPLVSEETSAHGLAVDAQGNVYGAEVWSQSLKKYLPPH